MRWWLDVRHACLSPDHFTSSNKKGDQDFALFVCVKTRWIVGLEVYAGDAGARVEVCHCSDLWECNQRLKLDSDSKMVQLIGRVMCRHFNLHHVIFFRSGRFTSLSMIRALLSLQTYVCATIHLNRGFPACAAFTKDEAKSLKRGQSLYATSADKNILAEAWKDSKPVYWLSSAIAESTSNTVVRRCKAQSLTIGWHAVIASYNGGMDGLDNVDASRSYFAMHFRRLKWCWLNLFFWLLEIALNNALVLYNAMVEFKSLRQKRCKGV